MIYRTRTKVKPAPVKSTVVLFDAGRKVKSPNFAAGILASRPMIHVPCTIEDIAFAASLFAESDRERAEARLAVEEDFDARMDQVTLDDAIVERYTKYFLGT
jgi:hypothetical protein